MMASLKFCSVRSSFFLTLASLAILFVPANAFSGQPQSSKNPVRVLVTGASGKTGRIVLSKLGNDNRYEPKGLFRTERSARSIVKEDDAIHLEHVVVADVTSSTFLEDLSEGTVGKRSNDKVERGESSSDEKSIDASSMKTKSNGLENLEAMIICTSAVPRIRKRSLAAMLVKAPWRALKGEPLMDVHSMRFAWKHGGYPELVDFQGQKAQIDLAKELGIPHVILVSAMGGTDPDNFMNSVGKWTHEKSNETAGHGDILMWKRKAEKYLVESGLEYTILHPGHLVDAPGGLEEYVLGVDDELYYNLNNYNQNINNNSTSPKENMRRLVTRISREDVAELCVAALSAGKGKKVSFDCITMSPSAMSSVPQHQPKHKSKRRKRRFGRRTITSSPTTISSAETRISTASETSVESRKTAEEALYDFLDLSISNNYDLAP